MRPLPWRRLAGLCVNLPFSREVQGKVHALCIMLIYRGGCTTQPSTLWMNMFQCVELVENWKEQGTLEGTGCLGLCVNFLGLLQQIITNLVALNNRNLFS